MPKLLKISLIISTIGILLLLIISCFIPPKPIEIKDINSRLINQKITIKGEITYIKDYGNFQIIRLKDSTGEINILISKKTKLEPNQIINVEGTVKEYKDGLEIQANRISN